MTYKVPSVLVDPQWEWSTLVLDGVHMPCLMLIHPVHGRISILPAKSTLKAMGEWIATQIDQGRAH